MPSISRRDFLNGVALTVAAGLTPAAQIAAEPLRYPPALTGLRGQHAGSFETAHAQAREDKRFALDRLPVEEHYDLVVVARASADWRPPPSFAVPPGRPRASSSSTTTMISAAMPSATSSRSTAVS